MTEKELDKLIEDGATELCKLPISRSQAMSVLSLAAKVRVGLEQCMVETRKSSYRRGVKTAIAESENWWLREMKGGLPDEVYNTWCKETATRFMNELKDELI